MRSLATQCCNPAGYLVEDNINVTVGFLITESSKTAIAGKGSVQNGDKQVFHIAVADSPG